MGTLELPPKDSSNVSCRFESGAREVVAVAPLTLSPGLCPANPAVAASCCLFLFAGMSHCGSSADMTGQLLGDTFSLERKGLRSQPKGPLLEEPHGVLLGLQFTFDTFCGVAGNDRRAGAAHVIAFTAVATTPIARLACRNPHTPSAKWSYGRVPISTSICTGCRWASLPVPFDIGHAS